MYMHSRVLCLALVLLPYLIPSSAREVNFTDIFVEPDAATIAEPIPKIAHFVFSKVRELVWLEYASIKSAAVNVGVDQINLWVPPNPVFTGEIWPLVLAMPELVVREIEMPTKIFGAELKNLAHISDVVRLEAVYTQGGIYMDYNLIALRSSDEVIYGAETKPTVMARQEPGSICNAFIMSKKHAPFLRRWMDQYRNFKDSDWDGMSVKMPNKLAAQDQSDVTVLDQSAWFYPTCCSAASTIRLFFGQTFGTIDNNFGVHQWGGKWRTSSFLTPGNVREIDTPFFCRIRNLFDNVGGSYVSMDWRKNPNCSFVTMDTVASRHGDSLISAYDFQTDTSIKWIDQSGNRLHGWAPFGMPLVAEGSMGRMVRETRPDTFAVLPVPSDYDARTGTVHTEIMFQYGHYDHGTSAMLAQVRFDDDARMQWSFHYDAINRTSTVKVVWIPWEWANAEQSALTFDISEVLPMDIGDNQYHRLNLAWDRLASGSVVVTIDDVEVLKTSVSTISRPLMGGEIWINGASDTALDKNLRARIAFLRLYSTSLNSTLATGTAALKSFKLPLRFSSDFSQRLGFTSLTAFSVWFCILFGMTSAWLTMILRRRQRGYSQSPSWSYFSARDGSRVTEEVEEHLLSPISNENAEPEPAKGVSSYDD